MYLRHRYAHVRSCLILMSIDIEFATHSTSKMDVEVGESAQKDGFVSAQDWVTRRVADLAPDNHSQ